MGHASSTLILQREAQQFNAGFCVVTGTLAELEAQLPLLHTTEAGYFFNLRFDKRKKSYLLGRLAGKAAVSQLTGIRDVSTFYIHPGIFQFPVVKGLNADNVQLSISHCDDLGVAIAFPEEHPLGIDIETLQPDKAAAMHAAVSEGEPALLNSHGLDTVTGYTILWTVKEALSKILRTGLTLDFHHFAIASLEKSGSVYTSTFRHFIQYKALTFTGGSHICTLVLPRHTNTDTSDLQTALLSVAEMSK